MNEIPSDLSEQHEQEKNHCSTFLNKLKKQTKNFIKK